MNTIWFEKLTEKGYRLTNPLKTVVEVFSTSKKSLSPIEIFELAKAKNPKIGLVSVYRSLEKLEEIHLVQRVHTPSGCQSFVPCSGKHEHLLLCSNCGAVQYFTGDELSELIKTIAEQTGYEITDHWLQLFGKCPECQK
ncbi:MAG TPA: transcriptional repressor [Anaerolineales bacterium]|nr:transcriptional repressor [Anaerolineales bacterium]